MPENIYKPSTKPRRQLAETVIADGKQGSLSMGKDGQVYAFDKGALSPLEGLKAPQIARIKAFIPIRDAYQAVLDVMTTRGSDADLKSAQRRLRRTYNAFVKEFGHVSKPYNARIIELDPNGSRVLALETTDIEKEGNRTVIRVTGLADIFEKRTFNPPQEPTTAASARDALVQSLAWRGQVDLPYMAGLRGVSEDALVAELGDELFFDPTAQTWVTKDEYLSGDVVSKLAAAEVALRDNPALARNAEALRPVQPTPLGPDEFEAPLGATWVPTEVYTRFLSEIGNTAITVTLTNTAHRTQFYIDGHGGAHEFLPTRYDYVSWVAAALNGRLPVEKRTEIVDGKEREVTDHEATEQVRQSLQQLREVWAVWWRADAQTSDKLAQLYNAMFNRERHERRVRPACRARLGQPESRWRRVRPVRLHARVTPDPVGGPLRLEPLRRGRLQRPGVQSVRVRRLQLRLPAPGWLLRGVPESGPLQLRRLQSAWGVQGADVGGHAGRPRRTLLTYGVAPRVLAEFGQDWTPETPALARKSGMTPAQRSTADHRDDALAETRRHNRNTEAIQRDRIDRDPQGQISDRTARQAKAVAERWKQDQYADLEKERLANTFSPEQLAAKKLAIENSFREQIGLPSLLDTEYELSATKRDPAGLRKIRHTYKALTGQETPLARMEALIAQAEREKDPAKRRALITQLEALQQQYGRGR